MRDIFDDFFSEFFDNEFFGPSRRYIIKESSVSPLTDLWQEKNNLIILFDLPGVKKEEIDLRVTEQSLSLKAKSSDFNYIKKINFPAKVLAEKAKSTFNNGVLEIIIPLKGK
jgi:HSP20 family protein